MSGPSHESSTFLNDLTERPISVYDNLNPATMPPLNTNCQKKDDEKSNSRDLPFCNISFKFDNTDENDTSTTTNNNTNKLSDFMKTHAHGNNYPPNGENGQKFHDIQDSSYPSGTNGQSSNNRDTSQYLDTTGSEAQQSTVIEKPVISDAKSKFFGLKGETMDASESAQLIEYNSDKENNFEVTCAEPQYQNVPSNSAVHRGNLLEDSDPLPDSYTAGLVTSTTADSFVLDSSQNDGETEPNSNRSTRCYPLDSDIDMSHHPSQVVYMSTTVPQNIKGVNIAGRHTPTRNSLRHSRMLVINKNYQGPKAPNALNLRHPYFTKLLLIIQIVFGVLLTFIGVWILLWAPNTRIQDNPYWSGLALILAGIVSLIVIRFRRSKRQKLRENCFIFLKLDSYVLTIAASILCLAALICASIHLSNLLAETTKCISTDILVANAACICKFGVTYPNTATSTKFADIPDNFNANDNEFQYRDLSCGEVTGAWKYILLVSVILNSLGFLVTSIYFTLLYWKKDSNKKYSTVRSDPF